MISGMANNGFILNSLDAKALIVRVGAIARHQALCLSPIDRCPALTDALY